MKTHANNPPSSGCISILMLLFLCLSFSCSNEDMQENLSGKEAKEKCPAYVRGTNPETNKGHAWVVDSQRRSMNTTYDKYEKDDGYDIGVFTLKNMRKAVLFLFIAIGGIMVSPTAGM